MVPRLEMAQYLQCYYKCEIKIINRTANSVDTDQIAIFSVAILFANFSPIALRMVKTP